MAESRMGRGGREYKRACPAWDWEAGSTQGHEGMEGQQDGTVWSTKG